MLFYAEIPGTERNAEPTKGFEQIVTISALSLYRIIDPTHNEAYANNAAAPAIIERPSIAV